MTYLIIAAIILNLAGVAILYRRIIQMDARSRIQVDSYGSTVGELVDYVEDKEKIEMKRQMQAIVNRYAEAKADENWQGTVVARMEWEEKAYDFVHYSGESQMDDNDWMKIQAEKVESDYFK